MEKMRYGKARGAKLRGVECAPVEVEATCEEGIPSIAIVGMPEGAAQEAQARVRSSVLAAGYHLPQKRIVVNLASQSFANRGSGLDLPIAAALLAATGQVPAEKLDGVLLVGELGLRGDVRPVRGLLAYALHARKSGLAIACAPSEELEAARGLELMEIRNLADLDLRDGLARHRSGSRKPKAGKAPDYADIPGCAQAKRALQIAAAGGHSVLLDCADEWLSHALAVRLPSIMGAMGEEEALETAVVRSACDMPVERTLAGVRPFQAPHHSASMAGLIGGGAPLMPGEASLAHNGVLYLAEAREFAPAALTALADVVSKGEARLARVDEQTTLPAKALVVAGTKPCPCGGFGSKERACTCTVGEIVRWKGVLNQRFARLIDMQVDVPQLSESDETASSAELKDGVARAREFAAWREKLGKNPAAIDAGAVELFEAARLSAGQHVKALRVARTVADLDQSESISSAHLAEALGWRMRL